MLPLSILGFQHSPSFYPSAKSCQTFFRRACLTLTGEPKRFMNNKKTDSRPTMLKHQSNAAVVKNNVDIHPRSSCVKRHRGRYEYPRSLFGPSSSRPSNPCIARQNSLLRPSCSRFARQRRRLDLDTHTTLSEACATPTRGFRAQYNRNCILPALLVLCPAISHNPTRAPFWQ